MSELDPGVAAVGREIARDVLRAEIDADGGLRGIFNLLHRPESDMASRLLGKYGMLLATAAYARPDAQSPPPAPSQPAWEQCTEDDLLRIAPDGVRAEDASAMLVALHAHRLAYPDGQPSLG